MDKIVGRLVDKTEALGIAENTLIIFTADNGTNTSITSQWNGQAIRGGKGGMTDMGTHVPMVAYWKGHTPTGKTLDDLVDFTDLYPTLAETAEIKLGEGDPIDGREVFCPNFLANQGIHDHGRYVTTSRTGTRRPDSLPARPNSSCIVTAVFTNQQKIWWKSETYRKDYPPTNKQPMTNFMHS